MAREQAISTDLPGRQKASFRFLLGSNTVEGFADSLTRTLLPILAVTALGLGSGFLGLLNAAGLAAFLLLGVPAGAVIDRLKDRRRVMTAATCLRVLVTATLAISTFTGWLSGPLLLGAAVTVGIADVVFTTALSTVIPRVTPAGTLKRAYSQLAVATQTASTAAAAGTAALLGILGMGAALAAAAASYGMSAMLQLGIRLGAAPAPANGETAKIRRDLGSGFRTLRATPALWALTVSGALTNAGAMLGNTVLPVFILRDLDIAPPLFAGLGALAAAGAIGGAAAAPFLTAAWGLRNLRTGAAAASALCVSGAALCPWLPGPELAWLAIQSLGWSFLVSVSGVAGAEVLPRSVAPGKLASVAAAQRTITLGVMPAAALLGGAAAGLAGTLPLLGVWIVLAGAAAVPVIRSRELAEYR
ncbi:MFS transporter [Arthrobacter sp. 08Y14]|uniref:MFS transporter n=1 Tax=Arthrobacter sp. 08Y14 TaxID=2058885 RepID=UPI000CE481B4|nr:MFS transporter [Arthrobacter sp. 08Y14]